MLLRRASRHVVMLFREKIHGFSGADGAPGSAEWLVSTEIRFGGLVIRVPRHKVSPLDPRSEAQLQRGGMAGGDRMLHHGYADMYAEYLAPFLQTERRLTIAEVGILCGTGLAIWCELFQDDRVLGFDIDLGHTQRNMPALRKRGAFRANEPELHEFDQFLDNTDRLGGILAGDAVDICIDDGFHSEESILCTMKSFLPHLADRFVYFVEDNREVHEAIRETWPEFDVVNAGELTVVTRGHG